MQGKQIIELAADLAMGSITADAIKEQYGEGMLSNVLALGGAIGAGVLTSAALNVLDTQTGIVSDLGSVIDDVFDLF